MRRIVFKVSENETGMFTHDTGFNLIYCSGKVTTAREDTLGVFCFKTRKQALDFILRKRKYTGRIFRVLPIGRGKVPKSICAFEGLINFYKGNTTKDTKMPPPEGTICYPAVEVLKEVK